MVQRVKRRRRLSNNSSNEIKKKRELLSQELLLSILKRDHGQKPHTTAVTVERESVILLHFDHLDTKNFQKGKRLFPPERVL